MVIYIGRQRERIFLDVTYFRLLIYNAVHALCSKSFDIRVEHDKSAHDRERDESAIPEERHKKVYIRIVNHYFGFLEKLYKKIYKKN